MFTLNHKVFTKSIACKKSVNIIVYLVSVVFDVPDCDIFLWSYLIASW